MSNFHDWLKSAWTNLLHWFGVEEQRIASFLYPVITDAAVLVKNDLLHDIIDGVPVVVAALAGGVPAALTAAETFILPLLEKQGVTLAQTTVNTLSNALVAQAKASVDAVTTNGASAA